MTPVVAPLILPHSYTYGWEYWEGHARLKERAEDAAQHAAVVLSNARLQAANAALEAQVSSQEHQLAEVAGDRQKITHLQSELHAAVDIANIALEEASRQTEHTDKVVQKYKAEAEEARVELAKAKKQVQQLRAVKKKLKTQLSKARQTAVALVNSLKEVVDPSSEDMVSD
jgi:chromosome segregation ATPase